MFFRKGSPLFRPFILSQKLSKRNTNVDSTLNRHRFKDIFLLKYIRPKIHLTPASSETALQTCTYVRGHDRSQWSINSLCKGMVSHSQKKNLERLGKRVLQQPARFSRELMVVFSDLPTNHPINQNPSPGPKELRKKPIWAHPAQKISKR